MRKTILHTLVYTSLSLIVLQSCKDDSNLIASLPVADQSITEEFDTLAAARSKGWLTRNRSEPIGSGIWVQGLTATSSATYDAYSSKSTANGFLSSDYTTCFSSGPGEGTISNWIISPKVTLQNGDKIIFYSRQSDTLSTYGDRLQVLVSPKGESIECGRGTTVGDFTINILDINAQNASGNPVNPFPATGYPANIYVYDPVHAYPGFWTRFEAQVRGLDGPTDGRFAFRHYVTMGGTNGRGGDCLSIDSVAYVSISHR